MPKPFIRYRRGAVSVEAALVIPLIFISIIAGIEFIRLNIVRHTIRNASYEAARVAMIPGAQKDTAIAKAQEVLRISGVRDAVVTVTPEDIQEDTQYVSVNITVPVGSNSWGVGKFFGGTNLASETELRTERSPVYQAIAIDELTRPVPPPPPPVDPPPPPPPVDPPPPPPPAPEPVDPVPVDPPPPPVDPPPPPPPPPVLL